MRDHERRYDDFQVQGAYRTSDDGVSWSGVTSVGSASSAAGVWQYGAAYVSTPATAQRVQVGFYVSNKSGGTSNVNKVTATVRIDLRAP